jgi:plastocyanin
MKINFFALSIGVFILFSFILINGSGCTNIINPVGKDTGSEFTIEVRDFSFRPDQIVIKTGDMITWVNVGAEIHTATSDNGTEIGSLEISPGTTFSHVFDMPGTYTYHCSTHQFMKGTIIVQ